MTAPIPPDPILSRPVRRRWVVKHVDSVRGEVARVETRNLAEALLRWNRWNARHADDPRAVVVLISEAAT